MAKGIWRREGNTAVPADARSLEFLHAHKDGAEFIAETHGARNLKQLRMFWALTDLVAEGLDADPNTLKKDALINLGYTETWMGRNGRVHIEAKSIAFESMTQEEFNPFFRRVIELMAGWLGVEREDLVKRYNEIVADKRYQGMQIRW